MAASKEQGIIEFYGKWQRLSDAIRTGWKLWHVERERVESISEHIFDVAMLAIVMKSQYQYDVNVMKVAYMAVIHELGEIVIGDYTPYDIAPEEKKQKEHAAVHELLSGLLDGAEIEQIFLEFDARETPEAKLVYQCDKLAAVLKAKWYDEESCVDLAHQEGNYAIDDPATRQLLKTDKSWSEMFSDFNRQNQDFDPNFLAVMDCAKSHTIHPDK